MKGIIYLIVCLSCFVSCKTGNSICLNPDKPASFRNSVAMFSTYIMKTNNIDTFDICDFNYDLVIDKTGKVVEAMSYNEKCRTDSLMRDYLLKMPNWNPAIKGKKKVKSIYRLNFHVRPQ